MKKVTCLLFLGLLVLSRSALAANVTYGGSLPIGGSVSTNTVTSGSSTQPLSSWVASLAAGQMPTTPTQNSVLTNLGNNQVDPGTSTSFTVSTPVPAGALIAVAVVNTNTSLSGSTLTDSASDTYTLATSCSPNANTAKGVTGIYYTIATAGLGANATITYTAGTSAYLAISAYYVLGPNGVDTSVCGTGSSTTASSGTLTPNVGGDTFVGINYTDTASDLGSLPTGYTTLTAPPIDAVTAYQFESGITPVTYAPVMGTSTTWATALVAFAPKYNVSLPCAPTPAAAVGYCQNTFSTNSSFSTSTVDIGKTFASGFQWYPYNCFSVTPSVANLNISGNGTISVGESGASYNSGALLTATCSSNSAGYIGTAFGGGLYAQATLKFTPTSSPSNAWWPAFWSNSIEGFLGTDQWTGQAAGYVNYVEADIMEFFEGEFSNPLNTYGATVHEWYNTSASGDNYNVAQEGTTTEPNFSLYHTYGMLWIPATSSTNGSITFYFDGSPIGTESWTQYTNQSPPPSSSTPWAFGVLDQQHLVFEFDSNNTNPVTVQSFNVWQASSANNMHQ